MRAHPVPFVAAIAIVVAASGAAAAEVNLTDLKCEPCSVKGGDTFNLIFQFDRAEYAQPEVMSDVQSAVPLAGPVPNNSAPTFIKPVTTMPVSQQVMVRITATWRGRKHSVDVTVLPDTANGPPIRVAPRRERHRVPAAEAVSYANQHGFETKETVPLLSSGITGLTLWGGCQLDTTPDNVALRIRREGTRGCGYVFLAGKGHLNPGWRLKKVTVYCDVTSAERGFPPFDVDAGPTAVSVGFKQSQPGDLTPDPKLDGFYHECRFSMLELEGPQGEHWHRAFD